MTGKGFVLRGLRASWWLILLILAVTLVSAVVVTARQQPRYRASAWLVVAPDPGVEDTTDVIRSLETLERRTIVATFAQIPSTREMTQTVADQMGWSASKLEGYQIRTSVPVSTNVLKIDVIGPDGDGVANVANAVARATAEKGHSMYRVYVLQPLVRAVPAERAFLPDRRRNYAVSALVGLFLGLLAATLVEYLKSKGVVRSHAAGDEVFPGNALRSPQGAG